MRAGRLTLTIRFSDGSEGVLEIGCRLPAGGPDEIMEGITVTKGFTTFWNHEEPVAGAEGTEHSSTCWAITTMTMTSPSR